MTCCHFPRRKSQTFSRLALALGIAFSAAVSRAQDVVLVATPDTVVKGSTQPIRFTWPAPVAAPATGLTTAAKVTIGGQTGAIVGAATAQSVTVTLPALDVVGSADVRVSDATNKLLAVSTLRLATSA